MRPSVRHIVAGTLQRRSTPLVIDLRRRDVPMPQQILHLRNVDTEIEQPGGTRRSQTMWRVDALAISSFFRLDRLHRTRQTLQIAHENAIHRRAYEVPIGQLGATSRSFARAEEGTTRDLSLFEVLGEPMRLADECRWSDACRPSR